MRLRARLCIKWLFRSPQELVDRWDWAGGAVTIQLEHFRGNAHRSAVAAGDRAPVLHVHWTEEDDGLAVEEYNIPAGGDEDGGGGGGGGGGDVDADGTGADGADSDGAAAGDAAAAGGGSGFVAAVESAIFGEERSRSPLKDDGTAAAAGGARRADKLDIEKTAVRPTHVFESTCQPGVVHELMC